MSFVRQMLDRLASLGDAPALVEVHHDAALPVSASTVLGRAGDIADALQKAGVVPGDRVALLGPNGAAWVSAELAVLGMGAISVALYLRQNPGEVASMITDAQAGVLLVATGDEAAAWQAQLGDGVRVIAWSLVPEGAPTPTWHAFDDDADAVVTLVYTSGTSGTARGVMLRRSAVDFMLDATSDHLERALRGLDGPERVFHYLPFCFAGSRMLLWTALRRGRPLWLSTDLTRLMDELAVARPHTFLNVPALLERIRRGVDAAMVARGPAVGAIWRAACRAVTEPDAASPADRAARALAARLLVPRLRARIGPDLRFLICGSAPLSPQTQRFFAWLGIPVLQVYGLTETTAIVTMDQPDAEAPGRVGTPIEGVEIHLDDAGELLVRGPNLFAGYWNRPADTAAMLRPGGWMATGDLADRDGQGRLRIIGRANQMLVLQSGHNVPPEPLEEALREHLPQAEHVVVVGHGAHHLGVLATGPITEADLAGACATLNASLPHYRRLGGWTILPEALTPENGMLTANQKLRRAAITTRWADRVAQVTS
jgi:long-chain acyl-CoA synthetase